MAPLDEYLYEETSATHDAELHLSPTVKLFSEDTQELHNTSASFPSKATPSRSGSDRMFLLDCRSSSLASEEKEEKTSSLFGEKEKEIIYTNFNEIFNQDTASTSQHVIDPLSIEKGIQEASQQILTPKIDARPPTDGKKLLDSLLSAESGTWWGTSFLPNGIKSPGQRINLDFSEEKKQTSSKLAVSVINDESSEEEKM